MKYTIVSHGDPKETENEVNSLLENGWVLHGNLNVVSGAETSYSQALIQYGDYEAGGIDSNFFVTIDELDGIKYAIESISDAIGNVATGLGGMAMGLSDQMAGAPPDPKPLKAKGKPSKRKPSKK